jgi:hypothetical protein
MTAAIPTCYSIKSAPKTGERILLFGHSILRGTIPENIEREWLVGYFDQGTNTGWSDDTGWCEVYGVDFWHPLPVPVIYK